MARVADHVYDHLLAVCRSASVARAFAVEAMARSPRSLSAALAHARPFALEAADAARSAADVDRGGDTEPGGLLELVWALAGRRPAAERSVADLAVRHGLDGAGVGRALGRAPAQARAEADAVLERWEREMRPALVAFLGPGECEGLRDVLAGTGLVEPSPAPDEAEGAGGADLGDAAAGGAVPGVARDEAPVSPAPGGPTVDALVAAAPAVADHLERCDVCPDRVRAMASVRSLLAPVAIAVAPPALQPGPWRRRPLRPAGESTVGDGGDRAGAARRGWRAAAVVGGLAVLAAGAVAFVAMADGDGHDDVAVLTKVPSRNALAAVPDEVRPGQVFLLESTVDHAVRWRVRPGAPWLHVEPSTGVLQPRRTSEVEVRVDDTAPEGELRADVAVSADDGSTVLVRLRGSVENPPTVAATADGCTVTAHVQDESEIASVELSWRDEAGVTDARPMPAASSGYRAAVPSSAVPVRWWVTAVDGRGNRARSAEDALASC